MVNVSLDGVRRIVRGPDQNEFQLCFREAQNEYKEWILLVEIDIAIPEAHRNIRVLQNLVNKEKDAHKKEVLTGRLRAERDLYAMLHSRKHFLQGDLRPAIDSLPIPILLDWRSKMQRAGGAAVPPSPKSSPSSRKTSSQTAHSSASSEEPEETHPKEVPSVIEPEQALKKFEEFLEATEAGLDPVPTEETDPAPAPRVKIVPSTEDIPCDDLHSPVILRDAISVEVVPPVFRQSEHPELSSSEESAVLREQMETIAGDEEKKEEVKDGSGVEEEKKEETETREPKKEAEVSEVKTLEKKGEAHHSTEEAHKETGDAQEKQEEVKKEEELPLKEVTEEIAEAQETRHQEVVEEPTQADSVSESDSDSVDTVDTVIAVERSSELQEMQQIAGTYITELLQPEGELEHAEIEEHVKTEEQAAEDVSTEGGQKETESSETIPAAEEAPTQPQAPPVPTPRKTVKEEEEKEETKEVDHHITEEAANEKQKEEETANQEEKQDEETKMEADHHITTEAVKEQLDHAVVAKLAEDLVQSAVEEALLEASTEVDHAEHYDDGPLMDEGLDALAQLDDVLADAESHEDVDDVHEVTKAEEEAAHEIVPLEPIVQAEEETTTEKSHEAVNLPNAAGAETKDATKILKELDVLDALLAGEILTALLADDKTKAAPTSEELDVPDAVVEKTESAPIIEELELAVCEALQQELKEAPEQTKALVTEEEANEADQEVGVLEAALAEETTQPLMMEADHQEYADDPIQALESVHVLAEKPAALEALTVEKPLGATDPVPLTPLHPAACIQTTITHSTGARTVSIETDTLIEECPSHCSGQVPIVEEKEEEETEQEDPKNEIIGEVKEEAEEKEQAEQVVEEVAEAIKEHHGIDAQTPLVSEETLLQIDAQEIQSAKYSEQETKEETEQEEFEKTMEAETNKEEEEASDRPELTRQDEFDHGDVIHVEEVVLGEAAKKAVVEEYDFDDDTDDSEELDTIQEEDEDGEEEENLTLATAALNHEEKHVDESVSVNEELAHGFVSEPAVREPADPIHEEHIAEVVHVDEGEALASATIQDAPTVDAFTVHVEGVEMSVESPEEELSVVHAMDETPVTAQEVEHVEEVGNEEPDHHVHEEVSTHEEENVAEVVHVEEGEAIKSQVVEAAIDHVQASKSHKDEDAEVKENPETEDVHMEVEETFAHEAEVEEESALPEPAINDEEELHPVHEASHSTEGTEEIKNFEAAVHMETDEKETTEHPEEKKETHVLEAVVGATRLMEERVSSVEERLCALEESHRVAEERIEVIVKGGAASVEERLSALEERHRATEERFELLNGREASVEDRLHALEQAHRTAEERFEVFLDSGLGYTGVALPEDHLGQSADHREDLHSDHGAQSVELEADVVVVEKTEEESKSAVEAPESHIPTEEHHIYRESLAEEALKLGVMILCPYDGGDGSEKEDHQNCSPVTSRKSSASTEKEMFEEWEETTTVFYGYPEELAVKSPIEIRIEDFDEGMPLGERFDDEEEVEEELVHQQHQEVVEEHVHYEEAVQEREDEVHHQEEELVHVHDEVQEVEIVQEAHHDELLHEDVQEIEEHQELIGHESQLEVMEEEVHHHDLIEDSELVHVHVHEELLEMDTHDYMEDVNHYEALLEKERELAEALEEFEQSVQVLEQMEEAHREILQEEELVHIYEEAQKEEAVQHEEAMVQEHMEEGHHEVLHEEEEQVHVQEEALKDVHHEETMVQEQVEEAHPTVLHVEEEEEVVHQEEILHEHVHEELPLEEHHEEVHQESVVEEEVHELVHDHLENAVHTLVEAVLQNVRHEEIHDVRNYVDAYPRQQYEVHTLIHHGPAHAGLVHRLASTIEGQEEEMEEELHEEEHVIEPEVHHEAPAHPQEVPLAREVLVRAAPVERYGAFHTNELAAYEALLNRAEQRQAARPPPPYSEAVGDLAYHTKAISEKAQEELMEYAYSEIHETHPSVHKEEIVIRGETEKAHHYDQVPQEMSQVLEHIYQEIQPAVENKEETVQYHEVPDSLEPVVNREEYHGVSHGVHDVQEHIYEEILEHHPVAQEEAVHYHEVSEELFHDDEHIYAEILDHHPVVQKVHEVPQEVAQVREYSYHETREHQPIVHQETVLHHEIGQRASLVQELIHEETVEHHNIGQGVSQVQEHIYEEVHPDVNMEDILRHHEVGQGVQVQENHEIGQGVSHVEEHKEDIFHHHEGSQLREHSYKEEHYHLPETKATIEVDDPSVLLTDREVIRPNEWYHNLPRKQRRESESSGELQLYEEYTVVNGFVTNHILHEAYLHQLKLKQEAEAREEEFRESLGTQTETWESVKESVGVATEVMTVVVDGGAQTEAPKKKKKKKRKGLTIATQTSVEEVVVVEKVDTTDFGLSDTVTIELRPPPTPTPPTPRVIVEKKIEVADENANETETTTKTTTTTVVREEHHEQIDYGKIVSSMKGLWDERIAHEHVHDDSHKIAPPKRKDFGAEEGTWHSRTTVVTERPTELLSAEVIDEVRPRTRDFDSPLGAATGTVQEQRAKFEEFGEWNYTTAKVKEVKTTNEVRVAADLTSHYVPPVTAENPYPKTTREVRLPQPAVDPALFVDEHTVIEPLVKFDDLYEKNYGEDEERTTKECRVPQSVLASLPARVNEHAREWKHTDYGEGHMDRYHRITNEVRILERVMDSHVPRSDVELSDGSDVSQHDDKWTDLTESHHVHDLQHAYEASHSNGHKENRSVEAERPNVSFDERSLPRVREEAILVARAPEPVAPKAEKRIHWEEAPIPSHKPSVVLEARIAEDTAEEHAVNAARLAVHAAQEAAKAEAREEIEVVQRASTSVPETQDEINDVQSHVSIHAIKQALKQMTSELRTEGTAASTSHERKRGRGREEAGGVDKEAVSSVADSRSEETSQQFTFREEDMPYGPQGTFRMPPRVGEGEQLETEVELERETLRALAAIRMASKRNVWDERDIDNVVLADERTLKTQQRLAQSGATSSFVKPIANPRPTTLPPASPRLEREFERYELGSQEDSPDWASGGLRSSTAPRSTTSSFSTPFSPTMAEPVRLVQSTDNYSMSTSKREAVPSSRADERTPAPARPLRDQRPSAAIATTTNNNSYTKTEYHQPGKLFNPYNAIAGSQTVHHKFEAVRERVVSPPTVQSRVYRSDDSESPDWSSAGLRSSGRVDATVLYGDEHIRVPAAHFSAREREIYEAAEYRDSRFDFDDRETRTRTVERVVERGVTAPQHNQQQHRAPPPPISISAPVVVSPAEPVHLVGHQLRNSNEITELKDYRPYVVHRSTASPAPSPSPAANLSSRSSTSSSVFFGEQAKPMGSTRSSVSSSHTATVQRQQQPSPTERAPLRPSIPSPLVEPAVIVSERPSVNGRLSVTSPIVSPRPQDPPTSNLPTTRLLSPLTVDTAPATSPTGQTGLVAERVHSSHSSIDSHSPRGLTHSVFVDEGPTPRGPQPFMNYSTATSYTFSRPPGRCAGDLHIDSSKDDVSSVRPASKQTATVTARKPTVDLNANTNGSADYARSATTTMRVEANDVVPPAHDESPSLMNDGHKMGNGAPTGNESSVTRGWDPRQLLRRLYEVSYEPRLETKRNRFINMEGHIEIPNEDRTNSGEPEKKWVEKYVKTRDGRLQFFVMHYADEAPAHEVNLSGADVDVVREERAIRITGGRAHLKLTLRVPSTVLDKWRQALLSHAASSSIDAYVRPIPSALPHLSQRVVLIELGSCSIRGGLLTSEPSLPSAFFPAIGCVLPDGRVAVGVEAYAPQNRSSGPLIPPLAAREPSLETYSMDGGVMRACIEECARQLKASPANHKVLVSLPQNIPSAIIEDLMKILLKEVRFQAACVIRQPSLVLYAYDVTTGVVVDIGDRLSIVPVVDGYVVDSAIVSLPCGARQMQECLRRQLANGNKAVYSFDSPAEALILRSVMEETCYVPQNVDEEKVRAKSVNISLSSYGLLPGMPKSIEVDDSRFLAAEGLFAPKKWGLEGKGLHSLIHESIASCPIDSRKILYRNIYLAGGASLLPGLAERLETELAAIVPATIHSQVHISPWRYNAAFLGSQVVASSSTFDDSCITAGNLPAFLDRLRNAPL